MQEDDCTPFDCTTNPIQQLSLVSSIVHKLLDNKHYDGKLCP